MRKNLRLIVTIVLSLMLAITMSHSVFADGTDPEPVANLGDAKITIGTSNANLLKEGDTFKVYQIIKRDGKGKYIVNEDVVTSTILTAIGYKDEEESEENKNPKTAVEQLYNDLTEADENGDAVIKADGTTTQDNTLISKLAYALKANKATSIKELKVEEGKAGQKIEWAPNAEGTYLIVNAGSKDGTVYMNMLGSVSENTDGKYVGTNLVVKASEATGSKEISVDSRRSNDGETGDYEENTSGIAGYDKDGKSDTTVTAGSADAYKADSSDNTVDSQSNTIGDTIGFTLRATIPNYPSNATDTTFYMGDVLGDSTHSGLSFVAGSIKVYGIPVVEASDDSASKDDANTDDTASKDDANTDDTASKDDANTDDTASKDDANTDDTASATEVELSSDAYEVVYFSDYDGTTVTDTQSDAKAFAIIYDYNEIKTYASVKATYKAKLNENAVVASNGNPNRFELIYSRNPYHDGNYVPGETPTSDDENPNPTPNPLYPTAEQMTESEDNSSSYEVKHDMSVIYTYSLAIKKTDAADKATTNEAKVGLSKAKFDVFADSAHTQLVGRIDVNDNGYGVLKGLEKAATYYLVETQAPDGYSLPTNDFPITLTKDSFDHKITTTTTTVTTVTTTTTENSKTYYTADAKEAIQENGAAKVAKNANGEVLYFQGTGDDVTDELVTGADGNTPAYVKLEVKNNSVLTTSQTGVEDVSVVTETNTVGENENTTAYLDVPNTKLGSLPATGGMGTYIFTIVGVCIMVCAAGLYFVNRKRRNA